MLNSLPGNTDEDRLRRLLQKLRGQKTDVVRLWNRASQTPDGLGKITTGLESPTGPAGITTAYTPETPTTTTTTLPTTTTTTTAGSAVSYLYPIEDVLKSGDIVLSSGTALWDLIDDRSGWPNTSGYIRIPEASDGSFQVMLDSGVVWNALTSVEIEFYCKNAILSDLITFTAEIVCVFSETSYEPLTDVVSVTVGNSETSYSLRTATFTLEPVSQLIGVWSNPMLNVQIETDNDAGSPSFFIAAVRAKLTYAPYTN